MVKKKKQPKIDTRKIVSLRLEPPLHNALRAAAKWNRRTMQQEMQFILEHRLHVDGFLDDQGAFADLDFDLELDIEK